MLLAASTDLERFLSAADLATPEVQELALHLLIVVRPVEDLIKDGSAQIDVTAKGWNELSAPPVDPHA